MRPPRILAVMLLGIVLIVPDASSASVTPTAADSGVSGAPGAMETPEEGETASAQASPWWTRVYAAGFYDTRWNGWFLQSFAQQGYFISPDRKFSLYGIGWLTTDSRSTGAGTLPVVISDNIFLLGAGIRFKPAPWIWLDAQEGVAFDLIARNGEKEVKHDFRFIATGGSGIYPEFRVHDGVSSPMSLMADCFASAGYYSRYDNFIAYLQGRLGARAMEVSRMFLDVYLRGDLALDANGDFYNNIYEIGPGLRFTPDPDWGLFLMVEYRSGHYADYSEAMRSERATYYPADYDAWRFFLVFDRTF